MSGPIEHDKLRLINSSIHKLATGFYKVLVDGEKGNFMFSPASVSITLSMLTFGARGNTENQLRSVLHLPADDTLTTDGIRLLVDKLNNIKKEKLNLANKIFTAEGLEVKSEFRAIINSLFKSEVESVDFTKLDESSRIINVWCETQTEGCIKDVVQPNDVQDASLILVNAIHFKGKWVKPFEKAFTGSQKFSISETATKEVSMMWIDDYFNCGDLPDLDAQYVELPFQSENEDDAISMYIIVPDKMTGWQKVEANLDKIYFQELNGPPERLKLGVPRFQVESKFELEPVLSKMGMKMPFSDTADFTGITDAPPLKISKVIQKVLIEVNEEGTEAGTVTHVNAMPMCPPPSFVFDKPFLCALVVKSTGTPILIAKVIDPSATP
ncbi:leukocyte elastase inhibitor isoform X3 [Fopius arisanus]|uniref:Leukocyte elastase inhibitor isoform X3 n=2 Tax=Fopius arisanus TaxID=64838 RepID=A0A9R1UBH8_9HYME|nr:PREDICTED: leukocyte elastase inhibitor-like isoform X3 [Fopius arisanus]